MSANEVVKALQQAGHTVELRDITPDDTGALELECDVIFPAMHGRFGEGGALQRLLNQTGKPYVGSDVKPSHIAIDKCASKQVAQQQGVPTPAFQQIGATGELQLGPPLVIKALTEGSSFGVFICHDAEQVAHAREQLHHQYAILMAEQYTPGRELTVGIVDAAALPVIEIIPQAEFYDYATKYDRDDTRYEFDIDLPQALLDQVSEHALTIHRAIGCRHLSRVDFMVDADQRLWFLEINTMPGMTTHSLVPKAAVQAGMPMDVMCDRLVRLALRDGAGR